MTFDISPLPYEECMEFVDRHYNQQRNPVRNYVYTRLAKESSLEMGLLKFLVDNKKMKPNSVNKLFDHNSHAPVFLYNVLLVQSRMLEKNPNWNLYWPHERNFFSFVNGLVREGSVAQRISDEDELSKCTIMTEYARTHKFNPGMMREIAIKPYPEYRYFVGVSGFKEKLKLILEENMDIFSDILEYTKSHGVCGKSDDEMENILGYIKQRRNAAPISEGWL
jgi:hypothetical protein